MFAFPSTRWFAAVALMVAGLGAAGCGAKDVKLNPVSGKILIDGKAPEHATIIFHPVTPADPGLAKPHGKVAADGTFTLTTISTDDGAPAGEYRVSIELWLASSRSDEGPKSKLPPTFANPETSGLKATIVDGPNELAPFTLSLKR